MTYSHNIDIREVTARLTTKKVCIYIIYIYTCTCNDMYVHVGKVTALGVLVLLPLPCCLFDLTCFLPTHISLNVYAAMYIYTPLPDVCTDMMKQSRLKIA